MSASRIATAPILSCAARADRRARVQEPDESTLAGQPARVAPERANVESEVAMRRTVTVPLSAIGLGVALALPAAAQGAPTTKKFTEVESGGRRSAPGNTYQDVYKIKRAPSGLGTVIRDSVLNGDTFPASGTAQAISYFEDGRLRSTESFTLGVPRRRGAGGTPPGGAGASA